MVQQSLGVRLDEAKDGAAFDFGAQPGLNVGRQPGPLGLEALAEGSPGHPFGARRGLFGESVPLAGAMGAAEPDDHQRLAEVRPVGHDVAAAACGAGLAGELAAAQVGEEDGAGGAGGRLFGRESAQTLSCRDGLAMALAVGFRSRCNCRKDGATDDEEDAIGMTADGARGSNGGGSWRRRAGEEVLTLAR